MILVMWNPRLFPTRSVSQIGVRSDSVQSGSVRDNTRDCKYFCPDTDYIWLYDISHKEKKEGGFGRPPDAGMPNPMRSKVNNELGQYLVLYKAIDVHERGTLTVAIVAPEGLMLDKLFYFPPAPRLPIKPCPPKCLLYPGSCSRPDCFFLKKLTSLQDGRLQQASRSIYSS